MTNQNSHSNGSSAKHRMFSLIWPGALAVQAIYCAARLKLADYLSAGVDGIECLSTASNTHPVALRRLMRALCSLGIVTEREPDRFALTELGQTLRSEDPSGVHPWAVMLGAPFVWRPWGRLLETIQTGETAFARIFGRTFEEMMALCPEDAEIYNSAMNAGTTNAVSTIVHAYDFSPCELVVDVGGGRGALLQGILEANDRVRGVLFDLPEVVLTAASLRESAVADRCQIVGGSYFDSLPSHADAYVLKGILHSQSDNDAIKILQNIRQVMRDSGRVVIIDTVLQPLNEPSPQKAMMDLMMLTLVPGHERTEAEFASLFQQAGMRLSRVIDTTCGNSIVEAIPC